MLHSCRFQHVVVSFFVSKTMGPPPFDIGIGIAALVQQNPAGDDGLG
jgi:hypothetical protein